MITYIATKYENNKLNWLSKYLLQIVSGLIVFFISVTLSFMIWEAKLLLEVKDQVTMNKTEIAYINKAVNNVDPTADTLRQLIESLKEDFSSMEIDIGILKDRTESRYER